MEELHLRGDVSDRNASEKAKKQLSVHFSCAPAVTASQCFWQSFWLLVSSLTSGFELGST